MTMTGYRLFAQASALALIVAAAPAAAQTEPSGTAPVSPPTGGQSAPGTGTQAPVSTESTTGQADQAAAAGAAQQGDIIVTANKRAQSINDVGLTIQAADASALADRGIGSPADLGKLVPGFTYTESLYSTPVFTLRGIGLYDATFGAAPAVSVYTDQIPRNVPVMSQALDLDLERIEVLKGPQGTLFGQSSTGGAINYILAKPTDTPKAGFDLSYERFDRKQIAGFVSTPLSDTIGARAAFRVTRGGAWQYSVSRRDDENGAARKYEGRLTVDWKPTESIKIEAIGTYVADNSDVQAPQYLGTNLNIYSAAALAAANASPATRNPFAIVDDARYAALNTPTSAGYDASLLGRQAVVVARLNGGNPRFAPGALALLGTQRGGTNRQAEWTPGFLKGSDNTYWQGAVRADWTLAPTITLTSITAFARQSLDYNQDLDATTARAVDVPIRGNVRSFNQELRFAGETGAFNWIVGGSYDNIRSFQSNDFLLFDYTGNAPLGDTGPIIEVTRNDFNSRLKTYAGFANAELKLGSAFTILGGVRYTKNKLDAAYCYNDPNNAGPNVVFSIFQNLFTGQNIAPLNQAGLCFPLGDGLAGTTFGVATRDPVVRDLDEDNWSFRAGANYKLGNGGLIYATVSQGFKTGLFSAIGASSTSQYAPAVQEKVISYEAGIKLPLADRRFNINAAGFYYDYSDKQVRGRIADPIYGLLEKLINVPESYVYGFEADVLLRPVDGLTLSASGTYLKSKVSGDFSATPDGSNVYNSQGFTGNFRGSELPYTPKWSANADAQYQFDMGDYRPFVGGTVFYQGRQNATFSNNALPADDFEIPGYTTIDLRAGVESADQRWKFSVFGRNITNKNYTTSITTYLDTLFRFTGRPVTYGASFSYRY